MAYEALRLAHKMGRPITLSEAGLLEEDARQAKGNRRSSRLSAPSPGTPKATTAAPAGYSRAELDLKVKAAVDAERARWANVMLSAAVKGREHTAAATLAAQPKLSSSEILARVTSAPSDAERERQNTASRNTAAATLWDRAIAANHPATGRKG